MKDNTMTFVPRNLHWQGEYLQEWGPRGKRDVKRRTARTMRKAVRLDLAKRTW